MRYAVNGYDGARRLMHGTTIKGERPIGAGGRTRRAAQISATPFVIAAKAGTQGLQSALFLLGPRFRGEDK
jgi:hypothetical protein